MAKTCSRGLYRSPANLGVLPIILLKIPRRKPYGFDSRSGYQWYSGFPGGGRLLLSPIRSNYTFCKGVEPESAVDGGCASVSLMPWHLWQFCSW